MSAIHSRKQARYRSIARALAHASSSTLAETLQALEAARLIERTADDRDGYQLTEPGRKLLDRLRPLLEDIRST